eukprot:1932361-Pyramimonas_sp.AAC.1
MIPNQLRRQRGQAQQQARQRRPCGRPGATPVGTARAVSCTYLPMYKKVRETSTCPPPKALLRGMARCTLARQQAAPPAQPTD